MNEAFQILEAAERPVSAAQLADLFRRSGIRRPVDEPERLARMIAGADLLVGAWAGGALVGVARALSDFSYCCYLSDLAVDRAYQRRGVGRALVEHVTARVGDEATIVLLAAPEAADYYARLGFERADNAWRLPRRR